LKPLGTVYLLDRDPELLELVADRERAAARRALSASAYRVKAGSWHPDALLVEGERPHFGVLVLFSHLADRFGKVTPAGITIPIRLTHQDLGKLVGATRQSISAALAQLAQSRALARRADGSWLLNPGMPEELEQMLTRRRRAHLPEGSVR
jgi:CRP-like cAMP-binding protein